MGNVKCFNDKGQLCILLFEVVNSLNDKVRIYRLYVFVYYQGYVMNRNVLEYKMENFVLNNEK